MDEDPDENVDDMHETVFGLVMPFVVCQTNGGPYEDEAFVAGVWFGKIDQMLTDQPEDIIMTVPSPLVPQLDLAAMDKGYSMTATPWEEHPDEWTTVHFVKQAKEAL